jgi:rubrerythrin
MEDVEMSTPKADGGATKMFLEQIEKDIKDFHAPDAENAIKTFIIEFLNIQYSNQNKFEKSKTNDNILLNINKQPKASITNIVFNGTAIYNYKKTRDYKTITYRVSVGYDVNGKRIETRYEIDYTLQLLDNKIATKSLKCPNCGGEYKSINDSTCPFCGVGIIKDTIMNWFVTEIIEL